MQVSGLREGRSGNDFLVVLCNSIHQGTAIFDKASGAMIFCNDAWLRIFEFASAAEANMTQLTELRRMPLTAQEFEDRIAIIDKEKYFAEQVEYISKKGNPFWGELEVRSFRENGDAYYLVVIDRIDNLIESRKKIEEDKQRFDALLEHASMGIIETNNLAEIININRFALSLFGYTSEELLHQKIERLIPQRFHPKHVGHRDQYIHRPRNRPMGVGMDLFAVKKDGTEFPVEVSLSNYIHNGEQYVIAFVSDISIRKRSEMEIKKLNDELEHTVELRTKELRSAIQLLEFSKEEISKSLEKEKELGELKSRFVSMASHEFRTPLSTVLSSAYLVEQYNTGEEAPKVEKHLKRIISSVNMLTDILNDFLSVGKIEEGKIHVRYSRFDMADFLSSVIEEIGGNLKKDQSIDFRYEGDCSISLDPSLVKHIVMNLVSNASKFSGEGKTILIHTWGDTDSCSFSVRDQGIGISREDQKHLMERFFRGTNAVNIQGTGLGLHIVSKYVELLGGSIHCKSEPGEGTEFIITFYKKPVLL